MYHLTVHINIDTDEERAGWVREDIVDQIGNVDAVDRITAYEVKEGPYKHKKFD